MTLRRNQIQRNNLKSTKVRPISQPRVNSMQSSQSQDLPNSQPRHLLEDIAHSRPVSKPRQLSYSRPVSKPRQLAFHCIVIIQHIIKFSKITLCVRTGVYSIYIKWPPRIIFPPPLHFKKMSLFFL